MRKILHVFTDYETRDSFFNDMRHGDLVIGFYDKTKTIRTKDTTHSFKVIKSELDIQKLGGIRFSKMIYHQYPIKYEYTMMLQSRVYPKHGEINISIKEELYFKSAKTI